MSLPEARAAQQTPRAQLLPNGAWLDLTVILFLGLLFLSPILISPHFGLFSDYGQILGWPSSQIHTARQFAREFAPLGDGRWTPMFHILTFGLYTLIGPSAFGFYLVQGLTLLASLAIVYLLARWLAQGSRAAGWTACLLILLSAPLAEDYFTLDKVEPRLIFFSLISLGFFAWRAAGARERAQTSTLQACLVFAFHFAIAVLIIFSKETGVFMAAVAFLALAASLLQANRDPRLVKEAALYFAAIALVVAMYVWLSSALVPEEVRAIRAQYAGGRYVTYGVGVDLVVGNALGYLTWMRDTVACMAIFCAWLAIGLWRWKRNWDDRHMLLFLAGAAGCVYFAGMLLWRWMLLYYMLPAVVFLAIAVGAIAFDPRLTRRGSIVWPVVILLLAAIPMAPRLPGRWRTAWTILAQDRSKDAIVHAMERQAGAHSKFVVAMFDVRSAEIGNSLEQYLALDGYKGKAVVYNMVEGPWVNMSDRHRYDGSAAEPPSDQEMEAARDLHAPFVIWRYEPRREIHRIWWMEPLAPGDLVLVPVGKPSNIEVQARGISAFSNSREAVLNTRFNGVQMRLLEEARVQVPLQTDYLGWDLLEVTGIDSRATNLAGLDRQAIDLDSAALDPGKSYLGSGWSPMDWTRTDGARAEPFRWGYNGAQVLVARSQTSATWRVILDLEPNGQLARLPMTILARDHAGREIASWALSGRQKVEFVAPPGQIVSLQLADNIHPRADTICFRLFAIASGN